MFLFICEFFIGRVIFFVVLAVFFLAYCFTSILFMAFCLFICLTALFGMRDIPNQRSNLCPLHWNCEVLIATQGSSQVHGVFDMQVFWYF